MDTFIDLSQPHLVSNHDFLKLAKNDEIEKCRELLKNGFYQHRLLNGKPLVFAVFELGKGTIANLLLDYGASLSDLTNYDMTKLLLSLLNSDMFITFEKVLTSAERDAFFFCNVSSLTPVLFTAHSRRLTTTISQLRRVGARLEVPWDYNSSTPLMWCKFDPPLLEMLLSLNTDINAVSNDGFTALASSVRRKDPLTAIRLLEKGADPNHKPKNDDCILSIACKNGSLYTCEMLVKYGADVNGCVWSGFYGEDECLGLRPLQIAVMTKNHLLEKFLREMGAVE